MNVPRNLLMFVVMTLLISSVQPRPKMIAIPTVIEKGNYATQRGSNGARVIRHTRVPGPLRVGRQAHGYLDYVDFGAHTGHHGAFGWFADFPVYNHH